MEEDNETSFRFPFSSPLSINGIKFSSREIDILACVVGGRTAKKIASFLSLSPRTVEHYIRNITLKLECNSRENLIDFVEKSDKVTSIKEHYASLLLYVEFENSLKEISQKNHQSLSCYLVIERGSKSKKSFLFSLERHLTLVGLKVSTKTPQEFELLSKNASAVSSIDYLIFINVEAFMAKLYREKILQQIIPILKGFLFLSFEEDTFKESLYVLQNLGNTAVINIKDKNYYSCFVEILKKLLPPSKLETIREKFELTNASQKSASSQSFPSKQLVEKNATSIHKIDFLKDLFLKKRGLYGLSAVLTIGLLSLGFLSMKSVREDKGYLPIASQEMASIRSDLILPKEDLLLNRSELIAVIDGKLKGQDAIQAIAIIGAGGSGKTTLARLYARSQAVPLIWEINAETHEGLVNSFEDLASALSKTEEDKKILRGLQDIKDPDKKENKILSFVKEKIKSLPNWLLVYDNVEDFTDIQNYFPRDEGTWGRGRVILTTRNHNVQNNKHVNRAFFIEMLNDQQKLDLFSKILNNGNITSIPPTRIEENKEFLKVIPSFPLDVSVAAYYLKATNISYKDYLESLENPDQKFIDVQAGILKDASDYVSTRYSIITLSLQRLLSIDKDFAELLLLISLVDSQNIPRDVLEKHKNKSIVDNFIYNLKKYSLINNSSDCFPPSMATFSIHRSAQAISLIYLIKALNLTKDNLLPFSLAHSLEKYIDNTIEKRNYREVESLISHCKAFINRDLVTNEAKAGINRKLGHIYTYLGNHAKSQQVLEESLHALQQEEKKNYHEIFQTAALLGNNYRENGYYEKAKILLEKNLTAYRQYVPKNHIGISQMLFQLGNVYRELGYYEKAKNLFEESVRAYEKYHPEEQLKIAWVLIHLGTVYRQLGEYKNASFTLEKGLVAYKKIVPKNHLYLVGPLIFLANLYEDLGEYEKTKALLEQGYQIQQQYHAENQIYAAWVITNLANAYRRLGQYEKAQALLEKTLLLYQKYLPENKNYINWVLMNLGNAYRDSGNYAKAKDLLEQLLVAYEQYFGKNHLETGRIFDSLGQISFFEGNITAAEDFFKRAYEIFEKHKHPDIYICLENLSEFHQKQSEQANKAGLTTQAQGFKDQANQHLQQALEIVKTHFPGDSPHITRIQSKIDKLKRSHSPGKNYR